jgi:RimJ/RimL family protein N-acetyltransferase
MIRGKKVILRAIEEEDLGFCQRLYNDPTIRAMVVGWDFPASLDKQKRWFASLATDQNNVRLVVETMEKQPIGLTGLWDIDWHNRHALTATKLLALEELRGKGYGRDAIMAMNAYAFFEVGLHRLWSLILDYNVASMKSYVERSGWKIEGRLRQHVFRNGSHHDLYYVACLKEDFLAVPDANDYIPTEIPEGCTRMDAIPLIKDSC